jgi:hypothetical protein
MVKISHSKNMLMRIFRFARKQITEGWRKLHNEELYDLYHHEILLG